ncbi:high mobility group protein [Salix suchowensis]|nr:high mobility group protein [Salix suchowensis]
MVGARKVGVTMEAFLFYNGLFVLKSNHSEAMKIAKGKGAARTEKKEVSLPVEDRKIGKRKAALKANESSKKRAKKEKIAKKDPNKPKRPPSAFFVFLEEFRKVYKQENPNVKAVSAVGKAGGEKWKSLSAAEKAPYEAKAAKRKSDYEKLMTAYNKKQETDDGDDDDNDHDIEQSHKSKSEVNGQDDESDEGDEDGDDDEDEDEDD